jgi:hypothetical protein
MNRNLRRTLIAALAGVLACLPWGGPAPAQTNKAFTGVNAISNQDYDGSNQLADLMMVSRG